MADAPKTFAATPGSPFSNLADQIAKSFVPNAQKYSNGSPFGRWQGTNLPGFGLLPSSLPDLFGYKAPTPLPWSRPWGLNQGGGGAGYPQQGTPPGGAGGLFGGGPGGPQTPPPQTSSWGPTTHDSKYPGVIFVPGLPGADGKPGIVNTNPNAPEYKPTPVPNVVNQINNEQWSGKPTSSPWPANYSEAAIPGEMLTQYAMRVGFPQSELGSLPYLSTGLGLPAGASYADILNAYAKRFHP